MLAKFIWVSEIIEAVGPKELGMPHVKTLGKRLLKIRIKAKIRNWTSPFLYAQRKSYYYSKWIY